MVQLLPSPALWHLDTSSSSRPPPSIGKSDPLPSPYLFGEPLQRVRTRTSSISSETTSPPSDLLASPSSPSSPYALGCPLSRIRTRTDSSDSLSPKPLYGDSFVRLTPTHLFIHHLLLRATVAFPLSRIRSCRPLLTEAQRIRLAANGNGRHTPVLGTTNGGLGWTGISWARDGRRVEEQKCLEGKTVIIEADGWVGRVGFSVEDPEEWWAAWKAVKGG
ncbi:hypothetical protein JCM6882_009561 [Rhodosporidiobolus microsporus]